VTVTEIADQVERAARAPQACRKVWNRGCITFSLREKNVARFTPRRSLALDFDFSQERKM
jgi:hypothetical protein